MFDTVDARIFLLAYDGGSFSIAAARGNTVVSAVSHRIRRMEEEFGFTLFLRTGRGIRPTPEADKLVEYARRLVEAQRLAQECVNTLRGGVRTEVNLIVNTSANAEWVPTILGKFLKACPAAHAIVTERSAQEAVAMIRAGAAELAIAAEPADRSGIESIPLFPDILALVVPRDTLVERNADGGVSFGEIARHPLISAGKDRSLTAFLQKIGLEMGREIRFAAHTAGLEAACRMVESGAGWAVLARSAAERYRDFMAIDILPISDRRAANMLYLCANHVAELSTEARLLHDLIAAHAVELGPHEPLVN